MNRITTLVFIVLALICAVSTVSAELIVNGGFEEPSPIGWTGGFATYLHQYQPYFTGPSPAEAGDRYGFAWGSLGEKWNSTQFVDVSEYANAPYTFGAWLSSYYDNLDHALIMVEFFDTADDTGNSLGGFYLDGNNGSSPYIVGSANADGLADPAVDWTQDNWTFYQIRDFIPAEAVSAKVSIYVLCLVCTTGDAYVDMVSFVIDPSVCGDPGTVYLASDLAEPRDCYVNLSDFTVIASQWLANDCIESADCYGADLDKSGDVTLSDMVLFLEQWLWCSDPADIDCDVYWR